MSKLTGTQEFNGDVYIKGVGNYDGTNPATSGVQTANAVISGLASAGYLFAGIATPSTNPGTPDNKVFYIAAEGGTYTNFGGIVIYNKFVHILTYDGTWHDVPCNIATTSYVRWYTTQYVKYDEIASGNYVESLDDYPISILALTVGDSDGNTWCLNTFAGEGTNYANLMRIAKGLIQNNTGIDAPDITLSRFYGDYNGLSDSGGGVIVGRFNDSAGEYYDGQTIFFACSFYN